MSSTDRQNRLLVAEDWKRIYQSFRNADFQSYDFENLRRTMVSYIRQNYPEDYNDYIESSEYLALIDLIAFLGQSIAFRVDLNARENFLELAERRESVLRLARLLSYNAKRNQPANGLLKFASVRTTQTIIDSNGRNIAGQLVVWNDPANSNWYDQFIKIINASLSQANQYGSPEDKSTVYGIPTEQYRIQGINTDVPVYAFNKPVDGRTMSFELVSTVFSGQDYIYEETPRVGNHLAFLYRDDGRGAASPNSGFFIHFRQGTLNQGTFTITQPNNNESIDIDAININDSDVWLHRLDKNGLEAEEWAKVPSFEGNNIIYNSLKKNIKNIYGTVTRAGDRISLVFSDGTFGNLPLGTFRTYYRTSNGLTYTINPKDMKGITVDIPYVSNVGQRETLTITLNLQTTVNNSTATESNEDIKVNAPSTYYTQNRMITGEDYNISPLSVNQDVAKIKSVNRSSSGISRYFDLKDPTGKYSSTNLFADDGVLYKQLYTSTFNFTYLSKTDIEGVIYNTIIDALKDKNLRNFYYENYSVLPYESLNIVWNQVTSSTNESTGFFESGDDQTKYKLGSYGTGNLKYIQPGALIKFSAPFNKVNGTIVYTHYFQTDNNNVLAQIPATGVPINGSTTIWASVVSVAGDGTANNTGVMPTGLGPVVLNQCIPDKISNDLAASISQVIPKLRTTIDSNVVLTMVDLIFANKPFGLRYAISTASWEIIFETNLDSKSEFSRGKEDDVSNKNLNASWLLLFTTDTEKYTVTSRLMRYIFESKDKIRFYFDSTDKVYDSTTNLIVKDNIKILNINTKPLDVSPLSVDLTWEINEDFKGLDGYKDTKKIEVVFADSNDDGIVDRPDLFSTLVSAPANNETDYQVLKKYYIVQEKYVIEQGQEDYRYIDNSSNVVKIFKTEASANAYFNVDGEYFYFIDTNIVKKYNKTLGKPVVSLDYKVFLGRDNLKFQYIHSADYESRIDPGMSNLMDIFVLTKTYDIQFRQWIAGSREYEPLPPSSDSLYLTLSPSLNLIKAMSDEVIYHPVRYKVLFGPDASQDLQATFKVVKNSAQVSSDNEIKANVLSAINEFFALENWDFGDKFYFSELSTYVMNRLAPLITNFILVPKSNNLTFGSLFEISSESDQLFINGASVDDIEIITNITASTIKASGNIVISPTAILQQNITSA